MLGRTHATSGAAVWTAGCAAATVLGAHLHGTTVLVGAAVCAGAALIPDLDHPGSLIARTFGPVSQAAARGVARANAVLHERTATRPDRRCENGHRAGTHTLAFAALVGLVVATVCGLAGRWAVAAAMFTAIGLALRGLLSARLRRRNTAGIAVAALGAGAVCAWMPGANWWWLGLPTGLGCLVHCWGDSLTESGCPWLWPLPIAGRRWYPVGLPQVLRFRTGSVVETVVLLPVFTVAGIAAGWWTLATLT